MRRALLGLLTGALLLAAIAGVHRAMPDITRRYAPIATDGEIGREVDTTAFRLRVDRMQVARTVRFTDDLNLPGPARTTRGVWVVVWATAAATTEALQLQGARLVTADGSAYLAASLRDTLDKADLQPGIPAYGALLFEIPADRLAGARLAVTPHSVAGLDLLGPAADIDLGLSDAYAARLLREIPPSLTLREVRTL
ncbi:hypothetical protein Sru01_26290 [Sphaerisporangium rufum]|uniref:DUF4352 domain-containing protein n=1 Tax=Sphaerisporangium rufum TaxID=1381558 RepID=A0A919R5S5_9ACTN|nr:hypothetical protein [Sphaerisporangium rufum]GII77647.1 hypothetical protein Sru01_26290 [Sphaerisporangium rufum]